MAKSGMDLPITVRPVRASDADELRANCFPELESDAVAERIEQAANRERKRSGICLVAELDGGIVGTAQVICREKRVGLVCNVAIAPDFRGRGLLGPLMDEIARDAAEFGSRRLRLCAECSNIAACRAYPKIGFRQVESEDDIIWLERRIDSRRSSTGGG